MPGAYDWAVVFDVDGPLLELTTPEEDAFFVPYERLYGLTGLSRDWDSYRVRNDEEIASEILERHLARAPTKTELGRVFDIYVEHLRSGYEAGDMAVRPIPGAAGLVAELADRPHGALGIATANILGAAQLRLHRAGMWEFLRHHPGVADGGGAKHAVLARVIARLGLPPQRVVFIGDNLNDLEAATRNGTHFVGFAVPPHQQARLRQAGARIVCGDHAETYDHIARALRFD